MRLPLKKKIAFSSFASVKKLTSTVIRDILTFPTLGFSLLKQSIYDLGVFIPNHLGSETAILNGLKKTIKTTYSDTVLPHQLVELDGTFYTISKIEIAKSNPKHPKLTLKNIDTSQLLLFTWEPGKPLIFIGQCIDNHAPFHGNKQAVYTAVTPLNTPKNDCILL